MPVSLLKSQMDTLEPGVRRCIFTDGVWGTAAGSVFQKDACRRQRAEYHRNNNRATGQTILAVFSATLQNDITTLIRSASEHKNVYFHVFMTSNWGPKGPWGSGRASFIRRGLGSWGRKVNYKRE